MATRAAIAYRDAEVQKRLLAVIGVLAERAKVDLPPQPQPDRDPAFRAVDERDWLATALETVAAGTSAKQAKE
jgi:hypothetical protein